MSQTPPAAGRASGPPWEIGAGIRWRILASILGTISWLIFTLLYVGFWAHGFSLFQSVIVILVSLLILVGILGTTWAVWGTRQMAGWHREHWDERWEPERPRNSG
jgi:hypothetical protein